MLTSGNSQGFLGSTVLLLLGELGCEVSFCFAFHGPDPGGVGHGHDGYSIVVSVVSGVFLFAILSALPG
jgi:hypothetical protein